MSPDRARVSVIVPTHDRPAWLRAALASIRALDGPDLDLELIVADDAGNPSTEAMAGAFAARVVRPDGAGAAAARNAAMRAATGDFLAFLDDDDVWLPGHLRPHLALLRRNPRFDAVVSQVRNGDPLLATFGEAWPRWISPEEDVFRAFYRYFPQIGATVARTSVLESIGFQDETLLGSEDWDWQLRLALRHAIAFVPVPSVGYRTRMPGADDRLIMTRVREHRRVFWANAARAGRRRPTPPALARAWFKQRGEFAGYLTAGAEARAASGDRRGARRALRLALQVSPAHAAKHVLASPYLRPLMAPAGLRVKRRQA